MSFPNHLIMDFNFNKKKHLIPYWTESFLSKEEKPTFIDEINLNKLKFDSINTPNWLIFLKSNVNTDSSSKIKPINTFLLGSQFSNKNNTAQSNFTPENLININFIRHERLYTKLKYSRSPAFDIVSGGAAALLAGFLGFLISEKFGFELVDSGDFYYLFMYIVFFVFSIKPLLYVSSSNESILYTLSYKHFIQFFSKITLLFLINLKSTLRL
jgi:hypothetical protein